MQRVNDRGIALIGVMLTLAMLMGLAAAVGVATTSDTQLQGAFGRGVTGLYAAESGLNKGMGEFKNKFLNYGVPNGPDFDPRSFTLGYRTVTYQLAERAGNPKNLVIPSGELFGGLSSQQYTYTVSSKGGVSADVEAEVGAEFNVGYIPLFQFVAFYIPDLEILPGPVMNLNGRVHANQDLYLNAENQLNIVDNPAVGITTIQVSTSGTIHRGRKNVNVCNGTVTIDMLQDLVAPPNNLDPRTLACNVTPVGTTRLVPQAELALWKGSMLAGIQSISVPEPDIIERGGGEFWTKADLRIVLDLENTETLGTAYNLFVIEAQDANGARNAAKTAALQNFMLAAAWNTANSTRPGTRPVFYTDIPAPACNCTANPIGCTNNQAACYLPPFGDDNRVYRSDATAMADADYRRGGFYNWREASWMYLLNVNIQDLLNWNNANGSPFFANNDATEGGLVVFLSVKGPSFAGQNNYGVRVFGSPTIPLPGGTGVTADPTGITVVSDQAMYVQGSYNSNAVGANPPRQPAALIGDSVNVLSQNYWRNGCTNGCTGAGCAGGAVTTNDCQSNVSLGAAARDGANTTINSAFLGGVDLTTPGNYNGGLENYPRFHEDWGSTLTYAGSFVSLGSPQHVDGIWCGTGGSIAGGVVSGCNIYNPPTRAWNYDPSFNNAANLPPLTPRFVYVQQVLFTESFK